VIKHGLREVTISIITARISSHTRTIRNGTVVLHSTGGLIRTSFGGICTEPHKYVLKNGTTSNGYGLTSKLIHKI
jgi:hypothetical protein